MLIRDDEFLVILVVISDFRLYILVLNSSM
jgi:hypothetical protein